MVLLIASIVFVFSACSTSSSEETTGETSPISIDLKFPEVTPAEAVNAGRALNVDPSTVASLTLIVTDKDGVELTSKTIPVTSGTLASISFDAPIGLELSITAMLSDGKGVVIFKGKSIPLDFESGVLRSITITMDVFNDLIGTWKGVKADGQLDLILSFTSDAEYFMAEDFTNGDPNCNSGMEHGFYSWDPSTSTINITGNIVDTTGNCGLNATPNDPFIFTVKNDTLVFTASDGESGSLSRVNPTSNPLVGSWFFIATGADIDSIIITFIDDSNYMVISNPFRVGGTEPDVPGMERGTYTWNAATGALSVGVITNTNGDMLFSDPTDQYNLSVSGNDLTMTVTDDIPFTDTLLFKRMPLAQKDKLVFETATVPGIYQAVLSDTPSLTHVYTFNVDGSGVANFADEVGVDPFNWSVDAQGVLIVNFFDPSPALPDRYTLVSGTNDLGVITTEADDNGDGVYELFPVGNISKVTPDATFKTTLKKPDSSTQAILLTRGAFLNTGTLPGTYQLLLPDTGDNLTVVINADGTGSIKFPQDPTPNPIVWKVTADSILRFTETDGAGDQWFWTITRIANNTQNALISDLTPPGQIDSADLNVLGSFTLLP